MSDPTPGAMPTPEPFTRTVRLGTIPHHRDGAPPVPVFAQIRWDGERLAISGVEGPKSNGNAYGSCGQIEMSYRTAEERANLTPGDGWTAEDVGRFFDVWRRWHLNDMCAGSPAQSEHLRTLEAEGRGFTGCPVSHYDWARAELAAVGLHPDPGYLHDGKPYAYGSAWLREDVPADVLGWLYDRPQVRRMPAWV